MKNHTDTILNRDRAFDINSLSELLTQGRSILTEAVNISRKMETSISAISGIYNGIDKEYKTAALGSDLDSLKGKLQKDIYRDTMDRMERILNKLIGDMPSYDASLARDMDGIEEALDAVKGRISELRGLLETGDMNLNYAEFSRRLQDMKAGWDETTEDLAELLAEIENDMLGVFLTSVQYSSDPVNLSTGNFVYEHEDMRIDGKIPLFFHRYYNAKDRSKGSLGKCYVHNYEIYLKEDDEKGKVIIYMGDGQKKSFRRIQDGIYQSLYSVKELLTKEGDNYALLTLSGKKYIFDKTGKLVREENQQKQGITFQYDEYDRLKQAITDHGTFLAYSYNKIGQLIQVTDHVGRTVKLAYERGKLAEVEMPQESRYIYHYGKNGRIEEVVNPCGYVAVKNRYDEKRRITHQEFPDGGYMEYTYDDSKRQVILTERNKSKIAYVHDSKYRNTDILYEDGTREHFEYNAKNQRILHVDRNGSSTRMAYDDKGNLTKIINPLGEKISITYDSRNNPINIKINGKEKQKNVFDGKGNLVEIRDALLRKTAFTYNEAGHLASILQPDGSMLHLFYDKKGNITEINDARGGKTYYAYDDLNRIVEVTDPNGNITHFSYDQAGNIRTVINGRR